MTELLAGREGHRTASIEEYVEAARTLAALRQYRARLAEVVDSLGDPGFGAEWDFFRGHAVSAGLNDLDFGAQALGQLLSRVDSVLADDLWESIETTVRAAAIPLYRQADRGSATLCVPDARGEWIAKGDDQLVKGTRAELAASPTRWTALKEVLPPSHPSEVAAAAGPGVS